MVAASFSAVDLFSGAGGSTTGATKAGAKVLVAANHWKRACLIHAINHPNTDHLCQDLCQADWHQFPSHDLLIGSPACTGHTRARGKEAKHHDKSRSTAWAIVDCTEVCQPKFLVVENVVDFRKWRHYQRWKECLAEDYHLEENIIDAADHGIPQNRIRLFIVGIHKDFSDRPVKIPKVTLPHKPAYDIIDWKVGSWKKINTCCRNTIARVERGKLQFGNKPFLVAYYGSSYGGRSLNRPLGTVTTHDRYALIDGSFLRMLTIEEYRKAMGFADEYVLPKMRTDSMKMLGNAVVPAVMCHIVKTLRKVKV